MGRTLRLRLLGPVQMERDGAPLRGFESRKALALLCYLALHDAPLTRTHLADLFWPDKPEARGRGNLSRVLHNLSSLFPDCLHADRHTIQFRRSPTCWLDVETFDELAARGDTKSLAAAVELYRGDLMAGYYLDDCPDFETWLVVERERWHRRAVEVLENLIEGDIRRGEFQQALGHAQRLLELDPWREEAHRQAMLLLARTGQRSAALAQYQTCRQALSGEFGVEPSQETTALYQRIRAAGGAAPHNLPAQPTPLVGRGKELAEIARLLADPDCRLVTLVGPGGIGKTRLALQAAADQAVAGVFLEGVAFVSLGPVSGSEFLISTVADALQFSFYGSGDPKAQLLNHLHDKEILLVLDSFEHLLSSPEGRIEGGARLLSEILASAPHLKLLVTSRERLNLRGEWVLEIQGLDFPQPPFVPPASNGRVWEGFEDYSAVRLFVQSAQRVHSSFSLSEAEKDGVARICWLVGGMPLAIELAAAWVRALSPRVIAQEIEGGLEFLTTRLQDVPRRHRSIQAVFDHSWHLLSEKERTVFRKLSVFKGGFRREAAEQVAGATPDDLAGLVDRSFLRRNGAGRYELHELLRQYGEETLAAIPKEKDRIYDLHCGYYADFIHQRVRHLKGGKQKEALTEIGEEIENVRSAWDWAVKWGKVEDIGKCLQGLWIFYEAQSWFREGEEAFRRAADRLEGADGRGEEPAGDRRRVLGQALCVYGNFSFRLGSYGTGKELLRKGLGILFGTGHATQPEIAHYRALLSLVEWYTGDYLEGEQLAQESLTISRGRGDRYTELYSLVTLGLIALALGKYTDARQFLQESLFISQKIGERRARALGLAGLGWVVQVQGDYLESKKLIQESLSICREISLVGVPYCLDLLGTLAYRMGDYTGAKQWHQESLEISRGVGERWSMACALSHLGDATCALGEYHASGRYFRDALTTAMEIGTVQVTLSALVGLATLFSTNKPGDTQRQWAIELLALVLNHPASTQETKDRAAHLLAELETQLLPQAVILAQERGRAKNLEAAVAEALEELGDEG